MLVDDNGSDKPPARCARARNRAAGKDEGAPALERWVGPTSTQPRWLFRAGGSGRRIFNKSAAGNELVR